MDMKFAGRLSLAGLMIAAGVSFAAAQTALNPLVIRSDRQQGTVPADCDESAAPASTPRVQVREIPLPEPQTPPVAPPSATLRDELRAVHEGLGRNDRAAFDTHLAEVRRMVRSYPSGAEKKNAEQLLTIYSDVETLWDAQYVSPFFSAGSKEHAVVSRYAGWEEAVRRSTLTDANGQKFYPARETRDFVARAVADPLRRAGITSTPAPSMRAPGVTQPRQTTGSVATRPQPTTSAPSTREPSRRATTPSRRQTSTTGSTTRRSSTPAQSTAAPRKSSSSRSSSTKTPAASSRPAAPQSVASSGSSTSRPSSSTPASPAVSTGSATAPGPSTLPSSTPSSATTSASSSPSVATATTLPGDVAMPTGNGEPFVASETSGTSSTDPFASSTAFDSTSSDPYATPTTDSASTSVTADTAVPATPSRGRSVLLPMILILIGLGVLIVLFRMSK